MKEMIGLLFSAPLALMFICLGLPLALKKVKRNYLFGYRISSYALQDDEIWYAVNALGGKYLIGIGALLAVNALFAWLFLKQMAVQKMVLNIDLAIMVLGVLLSIIRGHALNNKLAQEKGLKNHSHYSDIYKLKT